MCLRCIPAGLHGVLQWFKLMLMLIEIIESHVAVVGFLSGNQLINHKCLVIPTTTEKQLSASTAYAT